MLIFAHFSKMMEIFTPTVRAVPCVKCKQEMPLKDRQSECTLLPSHYTAQSLETCLQPVGMFAETERSSAVSQNGNTHCIILH